MIYLICDLYPLKASAFLCGWLVNTLLKRYSPSLQQKLLILLNYEFMHPGKLAHVLFCLSSNAHGAGCIYSQSSTYDICSATVKLQGTE